jgi:hypothetical protein
LPFSARVCLNQHHWIANRLIQRGVRFRQSTNAFTSCADPAVLQEIADSLTAQDLSHCGRKWLRPIDSIIHTQRTTASWRGSSTVILAG